jgi:hypothetical protein
VILQLLSLPPTFQTVERDHTKMAKASMVFNDTNGAGLTQTKAIIERFVEQWSENYRCCG